MNRFEFALQAASAPHLVALPQLTGALDFAVRQSTAEGHDPAEDPAVLLLGSFVAFQVHFDVNTSDGYRTLLRLCNDRLYNLGVLQ